MMSAKLGGPSFEMPEVGNPRYSPEAYPNQKRIGVMGPNHRASWVDVATWPPSLPWLIQVVTFLGMVKTWPFEGVKTWPPTFGDEVRSRLESPGGLPSFCEIPFCSDVSKPHHGCSTETTRSVLHRIRPRVSSLQQLSNWNEFLWETGSWLQDGPIWAVYTS